jgi:hypothetical protein
VANGWGIMEEAKQSKAKMRSLGSVVDKLI